MLSSFSFVHDFLQRFVEIDDLLRDSLSSSPGIDDLNGSDANRKDKCRNRELTEDSKDQFFLYLFEFIDLFTGSKEECKLNGIELIRFCVDL